MSSVPPVTSAAPSSITIDQPDAAKPLVAIVSAANASVDDKTMAAQPPVPIASAQPPQQPKAPSLFTRITSTISNFTARVTQQKTAIEDTNKKHDAYLKMDTAGLGLVKKVTTNLIEIDDKELSAAIGQLNDYPGGEELSVIFSYIAELLTEKLFTTNMEASIDRETFKAATKCFMITASKNILYSIPEKERSVPPNPLLDIAARLMKVCAEHIEGDPAKKLDAFRKKIRDIEQLYEKANQSEQREKALTALFEPLSKALVNLAFPHGISGLGLGKISTFLEIGKTFVGKAMGTSNWLGLTPLISKMLQEYNLPDFTNPAILVRTLYSLIMDPLCEVEQRQKRLQQTKGGLFLLHCAKLTGRGGPTLIMDELLALKVPLMLTKKSPKADDESDAAYAARVESEMKQIQCKAWLARNLEGAAKSGHPMLEKGKELTGFAIEAVMPKIFLTLAENNAGRPLAVNEDPLPYVAGLLKDFLLRNYTTHGEALKKEFVTRKAIYDEFREKALELAKLKAIQLEIKKGKKIQMEPASAAAASPVKIEISLAAEPDIKRNNAEPDFKRLNVEADVKDNYADKLDWIDYSATVTCKEKVRTAIADYNSQSEATKIATEYVLKKEIDRLVQYMLEWEDQKERAALVKNVFKPFTDELLTITGMKVLSEKEKKALTAAGKPIPTGFRLNILGLDKVIEESIPDGFCCLWELILCQFPGFMDWLIPDAFVKEKFAKLDGEGLQTQAAIIKATSPIVTNLFADLLNAHNVFLAKQTFEGINSQIPVDLQITDDGLERYLKGSFGHALVSLAEKSPTQTTSDTKGHQSDRKEANSTQTDYDTKENASSLRLEQEVKSGQAAPNSTPEADEEEINTTDWIKNNTLWSFINIHVEEVFLDVLSTNSNSIPHLVNAFVKSIHAFQKQLGANQEPLGSILEKEYAKLPQSGTREYDEAVTRIFIANKAQFVALTKDLLKKTGLEPLFKDIGKLGIFGLHEQILPTLPRAFFDLHLKLTRFHLLDALLHDQMCEVTYNSNDVHQKEEKEKDALHPLFANALDPKGKSVEQRAILFAPKAHEQAILIEQGTKFVADLIISSVRSSIHKKSDAHAKTQVDAKGFLGTYGLGKHDVTTISEMIKSLTNEEMDESFAEMWAFASRWLDVGLRQAVLNTTSSTDSVIPKADGEHPRWSIIGDVAIRIFKILGDHMSFKVQGEQTRADVARQIKGEIILASSSGQQDKLEASRKRMAKLFRPITTALITMVQGSKIERPLHLIHGLPLPSSLNIPAKIDGVLANFFETMTLDNKPMIDKLFEIYGSHHVAEFCRVISLFTQHISPFSLHENKDRIGKDLFDSILTLMPNGNKSTEELRLNLLRNRNGVEALFSHSIGLLGSRKDENERILMNDVMENTVWPFLQTYIHSFLLKVTVRFSERIEHLEKEDPDLTLKMITNVMQTFRKYLKAVHAATKAAGKSNLYDLSQEEVIKFLSDHVDLLDEPGSYNNIKATAEALKFEKGESPDVVQKRRIEKFHVGFTKKIFKIFGFTETDIPIPAFVQGPLFQLMGDTLMPLCFNLMFKLMVHEDGKEAMLDKGLATILHNIKYGDAALNEYTKKDLPPRKAVRIADEHKAQRKILNEKIYKESGEVSHESVQLIPEYLTQQALSVKKVQNMTTEQTAHVSKVISDDWKLKKCVNKIAEISTESLLPGGKWSPDGEYDTTGLTPKVSLSAAEKIAEEEMKAQVAKEVKDGTAMEITQGTVKILKRLFKELLGKLADVLQWICSKLFGKHAEAIKNVILSLFEYLGTTIDWTLTPVYILLKLILYGFAKLYTSLGLRNLRHPANTVVMHAEADTIADTIIKSQEEHPFSLKAVLERVGEADEKSMANLGVGVPA